MKLDQLLHIAGELPWFDLPLLTQLTGEPKRQLTTQLSQWVRKGKVQSLRRGLYSLANPYRKVPLSTLRVANELMKPSYLTSHWALSYYGLIPEKVVAFTSVTTRTTRTFQNDLGRFSYSSLKKDFFWGFLPVLSDGATVWIAEPEKALLDLWHLYHGDWSEARLIEMRFQNTGQLDFKKLRQYAEKWGSPRLRRIVALFTKTSQDHQEEYHEL